MGKPRKILIVDDDAEFTSVTKEYLESLGFSVTATLSPHNALEELSSKTFDLIISDYRMPDISGLTILEEIRGNGVSTPFLMVSGLIDTISEETVVVKGGAGLIFKPFKLSELKNAVTRALRAA